MKELVEVIAKSLVEHPDEVAMALIQKDLYWYMYLLHIHKL